ncbi:TPA_asm: hypothetical protein [Anelosimus tangle-web spider MELD virus]|nr:TPA_asm: hypothetical protein [Anelosimus tangle-web spider MELD virus]
MFSNNIAESHLPIETRITCLLPKEIEICYLNPYKLFEAKLDETNLSSERLHYLRNFFNQTLTFQCLKCSEYVVFHTDDCENFYKFNVYKSDVESVKWTQLTHCHRIERDLLLKHYKYECQCRPSKYIT